VCGQSEARARAARLRQRRGVREVDVLLRDAEVAGRPVVEERVADRASVALGDDVEREERVLPELRPFPLEVLRVDVHAGEARRVGLNSQKMRSNAATACRSSGVPARIVPPKSTGGAGLRLAHREHVLQPVREPEERVHELGVRRRHEHLVPLRPRRELRVEVADGPRLGGGGSGDADLGAVAADGPIR
jgi:hypothetical protein